MIVAEACANAPPHNEASYNGQTQVPDVIQFIYESDRELFENAMSFAQQQVRKLIEQHPDFYPMYTESGVWKHEGRPGHIGATDFSPA